MAPQEGVSFSIAVTVFEVSTHHGKHECRHNIKEVDIQENIQYVLVGMTPRNVY